MKIAIVRQKYRFDGGAERFASNALTALSNHTKLDVSLITRCWKGGLCDESVVTCNPFFIGRVQRERSFARAAPKYFSNFDLVQSHERIPGCHIYRAGDGVHRVWMEERSRTLTALRNRIFLTSHMHRFILSQEKALYAHPSLKAVICNSRMVYEEIQMHYGLPKDKLHVIYNPVSTDFFTPSLKDRYREAIRQKLGIPKDAPTILFVGSGFERKGLPGAIYAAGKSSIKPHLIVIGKGKPNLHYSGLIRKLKMRDRFHFMREQEDVRPYYGAADLFLLPTLYDPFPNAVLEAMASGLGVITTFKCGAKEIVEEGMNGFIRDALDYEGLAQSIDAAYEKGLNALGMAARLSVEKYNRQNFLENMLRFYERLI